MERLLALGAGANVTGAAGMTPLTIATARGPLEKVRPMLAHGADPSHKADLWRTALDHATMTGQYAIARFLYET